MTTILLIFAAAAASIWLLVEHKQRAKDPAGVLHRDISPTYTCKGPLEVVAIVSILCANWIKYRCSVCGTHVYVSDTAGEQLTEPPELDPRRNYDDYDEVMDAAERRSITCEKHVYVICDSIGYFITEGKPRMRLIPEVGEAYVAEFHRGRRIEAQAENRDES